MDKISLQSGDLSVSVSNRFGSIWSFEIDKDGERIPLMRPAASTAQDVATDSCCFPLLPFANRVKDNQFEFEGRSYSFKPNVDWDQHYLHGEGWLATWQIESQSADSITLSIDQAVTDLSPYAYSGRQTIALRDGALILELTVTNKGKRSMPFGLGWHPFFPMNRRTTLCAAASDYWLEDKKWLPTERQPLPAELDFNRPQGLPTHWVNNGFEGWDGKAKITWPDHGLSLQIASSDIFQRYFIFVSDTKFDPGYKQDFFCFEPMSHSADGHHQKDLAGLRILEPGQSLSGWVSLRPIFE